MNCSAVVQIITTNVLLDVNFLYPEFSVTSRQQQQQLHIARIE
jgi:hypothetical protein